MLENFKKKILSINEALGKAICLKISLCLFLISSILGAVGLFLPFVFYELDGGGPMLFEIDWFAADIILFANLLSIFFIIRLKILNVGIASLVKMIFAGAQIKLAMRSAFGLFGFINFFGLLGADDFGLGARLISFSNSTALFACIAYFFSKIIFNEKVNLDAFSELNVKSAKEYLAIIKDMYVNLNPEYKQPAIGASLLSIALFLPFTANPHNFRLGSISITISLIFFIITVAILIKLFMAIIKDNKRDYYLFSGLSVATFIYWAIKGGIFKVNMNAFLKVLSTRIGLGTVFYVIGCILLIVSAVNNYKNGFIEK